MINMFDGTLSGILYLIDIHDIEHPVFYSANFSVPAAVIMTVDPFLHRMSVAFQIFQNPPQTTTPLAS